MMEGTKTGIEEDPYDLSRFLAAQESDYARALSEVRSGRKRSHWMWYIFPQFEGLGPVRPPSAIRSKALKKRRLISTTPFWGGA